MDISNIIPHIEALIFASEKPLTALELTELINNAFGFMEDKITLDQVESAIEGIIEKYTAEFYPFEMKESGGGWQFLTKKDYHKTVAQLNGEKFLKRLSSASLETLAIIAYKQPITKGEVEAIRGVNSDYSIQKLLEKELIIITGRNEELPGKPLVYATSKSFMDYFGINSADELPQIKEILGERMVEATVVPREDNESPEAGSDVSVDEVQEESKDDDNELPEVVEASENDAQSKTLEEGNEALETIDISEQELQDEKDDDDDVMLVVRGNGELIETPNVVVDEETEPVDPEILSSADEEVSLSEEINEEVADRIEKEFAGEGESEGEDESEEQAESEEQDASEGEDESNGEKKEADKEQN